MGAKERLQRKGQLVNKMCISLQWNTVEFLLKGLLKTVVTLDNCKCVTKLIHSLIVMEGISKENAMMKYYFPEIWL